MKIKAARPLVRLVLGLSAAAMVTSIIGCASGPFSSNLNGSPPYDKPTAKGDDHTPIVYTSPSVTPAYTNTPTGNTDP
jgi:hypothetical protein